MCWKIKARTCPACHYGYFETLLVLYLHQHLHLSQFQSPSLSLYLFLYLYLYLYLYVWQQPLSTCQISTVATGSSSQNPHWKRTHTGISRTGISRTTKPLSHLEPRKGYRIECFSGFRPVQNAYEICLGHTLTLLAGGKSTDWYAVEIKCKLVACIIKFNMVSVFLIKMTPCMYFSTASKFPESQGAALSQSTNSIGQCNC